ncbi:MAG: F0F1 ATP synthase subunit gamma [Lentisphaerota bacterium]
MSETLGAISRKINSARKLESVVRTMKILAASNIGQYETAVASLKDYYQTVRYGLFVCLGGDILNSQVEKKRNKVSDSIGVIVFGSDQGLVGQFNDSLADFVVKTLKPFSCDKYVWAVGERIYARLDDAGIPLAGRFDVPSSVNAITPLSSNILIKCDKYRSKNINSQLYVFHNRPGNGSIYEPAVQKLLPLDDKWLSDISAIKWPSVNLPEVVGNKEQNFLAMIREYLFVSFFKACAESLMSENAARLAAMQRAEKNINELLEELGGIFNRVRQDSIDEELFDIISGST